MILLSKQWIECFNTIVVVSLYRRHLGFQSSKENFMSRGFFTGVKLTAVSAYLMDSL